MPINIHLNTPLETIEELHQLAETSAKKVSIDPEVLRQLLLDHSVMIKALYDNTTYKIKEPKLRAKI